MCRPKLIHHIHQSHRNLEKIGVRLWKKGGRPKRDRMSYELDSHGEPEVDDWQNEIVCGGESRISMTVLYATKPADDGAYDKPSRSYPNVSIEMFKPVGPRRADNELYLFANTLYRRDEGQITQTEANAILAAVTVLRAAARAGQRPPSP